MQGINISFTKDFKNVSHKQTQELEYHIRSSLYVNISVLPGVLVDTWAFGYFTFKQVFQNERSSKRVKLLKLQREMSCERRLRRLGLFALAKRQENKRKTYNIIKDRECEVTIFNCLFHNTRTWGYSVQFKGRNLKDYMHFFSYKMQSYCDTCGLCKGVAYALHMPNADWLTQSLKLLCPVISKHKLLYKMTTGLLV